MITGLKWSFLSKVVVSETVNLQDLFSHSNPLRDASLNSNSSLELPIADHVCGNSSSKNRSVALRSNVWPARWCRCTKKVVMFI